MANGSYKHYIPDLGLSIERYTANVPADGCYYVIRDGAICDKCRTLKKAEEYFRALIKEAGYKPKTYNVNPKTKAELSTELYLDRGDIISASRVH